MEKAEERPRRRARTFLKVGALFGAAALLIAGGWFAAQKFVSPEQRDAAAEPPPPGPITAEVQAGALEDIATAAGTFESEATRDLAIPLAASPSIVTASPAKPGSQVASGDVLIEVNGRPLLGLVGKFPFFRDLALGDEGPDVKQLQRALAGLGYHVKVDGRFGAQTSSALRSAYEAVGYEPPGASADNTDPTDVAAESASGATEPSTASFRIAEAIVLPEKSMRLIALPSLGTALDGESAITVSSAAIVATALGTDIVQSFVAPGSAVTLTTPASDAVDGIVKSVERGEDDNWVVVVEAANEPFEPDWSGQETVITMTVTKAPEGSLIVPTAAVVTQGASESSVLRLLPDGTFRSVRVTEIAQLSGRSAVQPVDGELAAGDIVRIG